MIDRNSIIAANPIDRVIEGYGVKLVKKGAEFQGLCPLHSENTPSFYVNTEKQSFHCFGCGAGGDVIEFVMKKNGINFMEAVKKLGGNNEDSERARIHHHSEAVHPRRVVANYYYRNELGEPLYKVVRYEPKGFAQCRKVGNDIVWDMVGVTRVLYRLPEIIKAEEVVLCEGEKDVETLVKMGYQATCNVGGAGKWMEGYTETLKGKNVVIIPDNDEAGEKHLQTVLQSITGKVKSVKVVKVPSPHKDISDWAATWDITVPLAELIKKANNAGIDIPIYSMDELKEKYSEFVKSVDKKTLDFKWLPSLDKHVRALVPGDVVTIIAQTGVGKTAIAQNMAFHAYPLKVLFFEIELADPLVFERFTQIRYKIDGDTVESAFKHGIKMEEDDKLSHIFTCPSSRITPELIEKYIVQSELKIGERPKVVIVDYIGLIQEKGNSRYERMSIVAEEMKRIAKSTNTIMVIASQAHRKGDDSDDEVYLNDAKDSGSIENSSGLVLGAWRESQDKMIIKILKNTKGSSGWKIPCNFDGRTLRITEEETRVDDKKNNHKETIYKAPYTD